MTQIARAYEGAVAGISFRGGVATAALHPPPSPKERPVAEELVQSVIDRATEVIGTREEAMRWLGTPVRALGFATPVSLLDSAAGEARVRAVLDQMEHGVL